MMMQSAAEHWLSSLILIYFIQNFIKLSHVFLVCDGAEKCINFGDSKSCFVLHTYYATIPTLQQYRSYISAASSQQKNEIISSPLKRKGSYHQLMCFCRIWKSNIWESDVILICNTRLLRIEHWKGLLNLKIYSEKN